MRLSFVVCFKVSSWYDLGWTAYKSYRIKVSYLGNNRCRVSWGVEKDLDPLSGTVVGQTDFDIKIRQSVVSDRNVACAFLTRLKTPSGGEVKGS